MVVRHQGPNDGETFYASISLIEFNTAVSPSVTKLTYGCTIPGGNMLCAHCIFLKTALLAHPCIANIFIHKESHGCWG
jgi:hypothetical protein